jgi:hypothetical protein
VVAVTLAAMTAAAQAPPPDGVAQFHRREQAAQQQRTAADATQQELAERSRNRWIASGGEEWGSGRGPLSLEPEPSEPASGRPRVSAPSRRREALRDRCAPTHATTKVAANRPAYWSEACSPPRRSQLR